MVSKEIIIYKINYEKQLKEELEEIYIYLDSNKRTIEVKYNDELSFPFDVEKRFIKYFSKRYKFQSKKTFDNIIDVRARVTKETGTIVFTYELKDNFFK